MAQKTQKQFRYYLSPSGSLARYDYVANEYLVWYPHLKKFDWHEAVSCNFDEDHNPYHGREIRESTAMRIIERTSR